MVDKKNGIEEVQNLVFVEKLGEGVRMGLYDT